MTGRKRGAALLVCFLLVGFVPYRTIWGGGAIEVSVTVAVSELPAWVSCETVSTEESAHGILEHCYSEEIGLGFTKQSPFENRPLILRVPTGERTIKSLLWSRTWLSRMPFMVVLVGYSDGRRAGKRVTLPDVRKVKTVQVDFP
jgi:hypothetical protein